MTSARVAALLLLLVAPVARGQTTERTGAEPRVVVAGRGAQAQGPDGAWKALERDDVVVIGAGIKGGAGTVLRWQDGPQDVGELVALEPGAQVTITEDRELGVVSGACFLQINARIDVSAAWGKVELTGGDARVEVERGGQMVVLATNRICIVQTSGARQEVPPGQTATIATDGAVRVTAGRPPQVPAWLARLWRLDPRAIVYVQDFAQPLATSTGTFSTGCLTGVSAGGWPSLAGFSDWNKNLFAIEERLAVRCQLRLSAPAPLTVMLNVKEHANMFDTRTLVRGGELIEVELELAAFASRDETPRRFATGDQVWSFTIMAGHHASPDPVQVEVRRLIVFRRPPTR